jgi:hypothetical protein
MYEVPDSKIVTIEAEQPVLSIQSLRNVFFLTVCYAKQLEAGALTYPHIAAYSGASVPESHGIPLFF